MNRFYDATLAGEIAQLKELSTPNEEPIAILAEQAKSHPSILEELPVSVLEKILAYLEEENQLKLLKKNAWQD